MSESLHPPIPHSGEHAQSPMEFYCNAGEAWAAMFEDCRKATKSIELEQYIVHPDKIGESFLELLADKAKEGVHVRLIMDAVGSRDMRSSPTVDALRAAGGEVIFYRPLWIIHALFPTTWFPRVHCKTLIIDGKISYVGSMCMMKYMEQWRDTHVRVKGRVTQAASDYFARFWRRLNGDRSERKALATHHLEDTPVQFVISHPGRRKRRLLYRELLSEISQAQKYVYLATPYFFPPRPLMKALKRAKLRGVEVTIITSCRSDVAFADRVKRCLIPYFLRTNIRLLLYTATIFHAKYAVIDDRWATVGSSNFDHLSLLYNREANLVLRGANDICILKAHFLRDSHSCRPASRADWERQSWSEKLAGLLGSLIYKLL